MLPCHVEQCKDLGICDFVRQAVAGTDAHFAAFEQAPWGSSSCAGHRWLTIESIHSSLESSECLEEILARAHSIKECRQLGGKSVDPNEVIRGQKVVPIRVQDLQLHQADGQVVNRSTCIRIACALDASSNLQELG